MGQEKKGSDLEDLESDGRNVVSHETVSNWYNLEAAHFRCWEDFEHRPSPG